MNKLHVSFEILNEEDIFFIQNFQSNQDELLRTALTIGLKSIQMSEVKMDCHSYIEPIQKIVSESTESNHKSLDSIEDKLDSLLNLKANATRKGKLSENICCRILTEYYSSWDITDVSSRGYEGDCKAITEFGTILYEFKAYDTNIPKKEIEKFHRDLYHTGVKFGVFVSNTSGIFGKKMIEWEILKDDILVVYISNFGLNGYGCIVGTEILLSLQKMNHSMDHKIIYKNENLEEIMNLIEPQIYQLQTMNQNISKFRELIQEQKIKINSCIDLLEKNIFQIEYESHLICKEIIQSFEILKPSKEHLCEFSEESFLENIDIPKIKLLYQQFFKIMNTNQYHIYLQNNNLCFEKGNTILFEIHSFKNKVELYFYDISDTLMIHRKYEKFNGNHIIIELKDNSEFWIYLKNKLN